MLSRFLSAFLMRSKISRATAKCLGIAMLIIDATHTACLFTEKHREKHTTVHAACSSLENPFDRVHMKFSSSFLETQRYRRVHRTDNDDSAGKRCVRCSVGTKKEYSIEAGIHRSSVSPLAIFRHSGGFYWHQNGPLLHSWKMFADDVFFEASLNRNFKMKLSSGKSGCGNVV